MRRPLAFGLISAFVAAAAAAACGGGGSGTTGGGGSTATSTGDATTGGGSASTTASSTGMGGGSATSTSTGTATSTGAATGTGSTGSAGGGPPGPPTASQLLAAIGMCNTVSTSGYKTDADPGLPSNIPICGLKNAVYWQADMDVDCDGKTTPQCNLNTDPAYQNQTSATDSNGQPLDAANLPYVVVPLPSTRWDYNAAGLAFGSVIAVIYNGKVEYGVFGDEGPKAIIGEASYAMAQSLGVNPDPSVGGVDSGVTYIAFTGPAAVASPIEDHAAAVALGQQLAAALVANP
jgi:Fungal chitosanase of glycosyl hydrolase group 75